jgi:acyl dehydratase
VENEREVVRGWAVLYMALLNVVHSRGRHIKPVQAGGGVRVKPGETSE